VTTSSVGPFDPADPDFISDPYSTFHTLRRRAAIHDHLGLGMRVAVSHTVCSQVLRDRRFARVWSDIQPAEQFPQFNRIHRYSMLSNDAGHDRLRSAVSTVFSRRRMEQLRALVTRHANTLVTGLAERIAEDGHADPLEHVGAPLSVGVIAEWLGFPDGDRPLLRPWSNAIVKMYEYHLDAAARINAEKAAAQFADYVTDLVRHRRRHPGDDLLSELLTTSSASPSGLTDEELIANYILLLMAGHEASVNALGNAVVALYQHPDRWQQLRTDLVTDTRSLEVAVDELIRYDTPNQLFERTALEDVEIAGHHFRPGDKIGLLLGAANRDPAVFPAPDVLDLTRSPNPHVGLGAGMHYCLGAPLARMELASALSSLASKLPHFDLATEPRRRPEYVIRGFTAVNLTDGST
jgi:cytochrome P450